MDDTIIFEATDSFSVPVKIIDDHLQAPPVALRLILFLLRNKNASFTKEDIITAVNAPEQDVKDAFTYWCKAGILYKAGSRYLLERPKLAATEIMKYTPSQIADRIKTDSGLRFLYNMAEKLFAKTISDSDASLILSLVDWNGLSVEAVGLLLQYAADMGMSLSRVQKLGLEWMENGITTAEKAEEYMKTQREKKEIQNRIAQMLGIQHRALTEGERKAFLTWVSTYSFSFDMIKSAYDKTVANTGKYSYAYMEKILNGWYTKGYKTAFDVEEGEKKNKPVKKTEAKKKNTPEKKKNPELSKSMDDSWAIVVNDLEKDNDDE